MLLKNFGAYCAAGFTGIELSNGLKNTVGAFPKGTGLRKLPTNNLNLLSDIVDAATYTSDTSSSYGYWYFIFGDGTTPPTVDDYKLSGDIVVPTKQDANVSSGSNGATWSITALNNTNTPMTIGELGLCISKTGGGCVMLTRDVLPTPVVLEAGASRTFEIFIDTQSFVEQ